MFVLSLLLHSASGAQSNSADTAASQTAPIANAYSIALQPWWGNYDGMVERRMLRIAVPYSMTHYFLDGASERGVAAAMGRELERQINRREGLRTRLMHVVFIPAPRNQLLDYLAEGLADIAMGGLAPTTAREQAIDFSIPFIRNTEALLVTGPGAGDFASTSDLAGQTVFVQRTGDYFEPLAKLSDSLVARGLPPIAIEPVDDRLEPDEILELVQSGQLPLTVSDRHLANFWSQVFPELEVHSEIVVGPPRNLAWAFRAESPQLAEVLNEFLRAHRPRTEFGNIILRRYLQSVRWVENPMTSRNRARFDQTIPLFRKYGDHYGIDPLLLAALGYQESRLEQSTRSPAGAIGVMQLLPRTGASLGVGDITELEPNIHGGTKYLSYLMEERVASADVDQLNTMFFALASYNAGQTRVRRLRRQAVQQSLDPNVWHDNVELLAAREIGRETVQYVDNIYKYYLAYRRVEAQRLKRAERADNGE